MKNLRSAAWIENSILREALKDLNLYEFKKCPSYSGGREQRLQIGDKQESE